MDWPLYLDTARLGRMSPAACRAQKDFAELASEAGGSIYFERVLKHGLAAGLSGWERRFSGLCDWRGIGGLKESLRELAGSVPELPVLLANRSAELMKLSARLLFRRCRNVMATDLGWPAYHDVLHREALRANQRVTTISVRDDLLTERLDEVELVERVSREFKRAHCDGLFLSAVSNLGVRLPVERIVLAAEEAGQVWFVVVDGAQDFCHVGTDLRHDHCDLYLAGCHKWLGAYQPMGLGFYGRRRSQGLTDTVLADMLEAGDLNDPLLRFSRELESDEPGGLGETVNLGSLFSCQGAVSDALRVGAPCKSTLPSRLQNSNAVTATAEGSGWSPRLPEPALRSGILLLQAERAKTRELPPESIRSSFAEAGVLLTAYDGGLVRLSMPIEALQPELLDGLNRALQLAA